MKKAIFILCTVCAAVFIVSSVATALAATIDDHGIGYSGYYFNDPTGYREVFTEQVTFHLQRNRPSSNNEFFVTFTPAADIPNAYGISVDDPVITDSELVNSQETNYCPQPFLIFHDGGAAVSPVSPYCGDPMFRGSATSSAWAILYGSGPVPLATSTYHLQAGVSYDIVGWWYSGTPANLVDGQTITIGIWEPSAMPAAQQELSREPVVIVPGIMGSRLNMASSGTEVWPNAAAMMLSGTDSYLDALKLSPSGGEIPGKEIYPSDIVRTVTTSIPFVGTDLYKPLIDAFLSDGYEEGKDLFVAPYDWRLDIPSSADHIGVIVQTAVAHSPNGKINVIAHSMGGFVVADYLARATSTAFLDKLILAGAPQLGAPAIFKDLEYGDDLGFNVFGSISLLNPHEVKSISQNMPGVYALLPTRRYVGIEGGYIFDARSGSTAPLSFDFDQTSQFMTSDPDDSRNDALLAAADAFHAGADIAPVNAPEIYNLVGCQNPATIKSFILQDGGAVDIVRGNGDGSVPVDSAMNMANGYRNYFSLYAENGADHVGLVRASGPLALIRAIIRNATATLSLTPLGVSTSSEDCLQGRSQLHSETTVEVSARGTVVLNAYDADGRHTGPNADGGIDLRIPGSSYQAIGPNSFILFPASSTYRVVAQGTSASASSSATFEIKQYDDASDLTKTATYVEVPIASVSTTATFIITSSTPAPPLTLDSKGTGAPEATIPATALLDAFASRDHEPPLITVSGVPTNVIVGTTTTITFSFVDTGTGIATSSATMNGIPLISGGTVTFNATGTATFRFFTEDNAGNPASREYHVSVLPAGGSCRVPESVSGSV